MKKTIGLILALCTLFCFAGCSQNLADKNTETLLPQGDTKTSSPIGAAQVDVPPLSNEENPPENAATLKAKIISVDGSTVLLAGLGEQDADSSLFFINTDGVLLQGFDDPSSTLAPGMEIALSYNDFILETFPAQIPDVYSITLEKRGDDLVGLFLSALDELMETDAALNDNITLLAFDLSGEVNLTQSEKSALLYRAGQTYDLETRAGTFDELCEEGLIDRDRLYFESGLLITLSDEKLADGTFTFDLDKWRSGLGAYFFADCTALKNGDVWQYTIGGHAIS